MLGFGTKQAESEYVDTNGDGVPDAFERRPSITEILNAPEGSLPCDRESVVVEIEKTPRPPKKGEWYCMAERFEKATFDFDSVGGMFTAMIVRRVIAGKLP